MDVEKFGVVVEVIQNIEGFRSRIENFKIFNEELLKNRPKVIMSEEKIKLRRKRIESSVKKVKD